MRVGANVQMRIIDGVEPERVCIPLSSSEVSDFLKAASIDGQNVVPSGGGTALEIGNPAARIDVLLDTSSLAGVIDYKPTDLMVSVRAGTTIGDLSDVLAEHGQELPLDIAFADRATVGGVVATAFAGPRRFGSGTLKDLLVGCEYVRGDGMIAKAGGMVVKNVSGFEIPRLLHGSWGTLAVVTSANFKVTPIAKGDLTLSVRFPSITEAIEAAHRTLMSGVSIVSCEIVYDVQEIHLLLRLQGREDGVRAQLIGVQRLLDGSSMAVHEGEASRQFWQQHVDHFAAADGLGQVVIGMRPRDLAAMLMHVGSMPAGFTQEVCASPATGTVRIRFDHDQVAADEFWSTVTPKLPMAGLSMMVEFASLDWKRGLDIWGVAPAGLEIMRAVKSQFDPAGVLNRGRMMI